jgi:hypothetical protein
VLAPLAAVSKIKPRGLGTSLVDRAGLDGRSDQVVVFEKPTAEEACYPWTYHPPRIRS